MGMFDELRCDYPLPAKDANEILYQTKDTPPQWMDQFLIDKDGQLHHEEYETEDRSDPKAEGLHRLMGSMTRVNKRWVPVTNFTGEIAFYEYPGADQWLEFSSYFVKGKLQSLNLIADTRKEQP